MADKIVALGGTPTTVPAPVPITTDNRRMLQLALQSERDTVERYKTRVDQADALGEVALKVRLEDLIVDETHHAGGDRARPHQLEERTVLPYIPAAWVPVVSADPGGPRRREAGGPSSFSRKSS